MSNDLRPVSVPVSLSIPDAAAAVGYSETVIKEYIAKGDLSPRYANTKGVILYHELLEWVESLPIEKPAERNRRAS